MCALLRIKNATGPVNDDRRARYMKDQTRILVKILGILRSVCIYLCTTHGHLYHFGDGLRQQTEVYVSVLY